MGTANMIGLLTTVSIFVLSSASASLVPLGESAPESQAQHVEAESETTANCPDKWLDASFMDMGCLYFNSTQGLTWDDANSVCAMSSNSTLVDIATEVQMGFLQMELDVMANAEGTTHQWWTAGTDLGIEGRWIWATTLTAVEDFIWIDGYPRYPAPYANCLSLEPTRGYFGYDEGCSAKRFPICQLK